MIIKTWIKYEDSYLPTPRCKKLRYKECEEYIDAELKEIDQREMKLAFEDNSFEGDGKIYYYNNKLWKKTKRNMNITKENGTKSALEDLIWASEHCSTYFSFDFDRIHYGKDTSRENTIKSIKSDMENRLLVDGVLFETTYEPRYIILNFGGGKDFSVGMFVLEEVVEPVVIMKHGTSYGSGGTYEYLELWTDSVRPKTTVKLDGYTEILIR